MACPSIIDLFQRTRQLDESEEEPVQEQRHSGRNIQEPDESEEGASKTSKREAPDKEQKKRIKWPKRSTASRWVHFESDAVAALDIVLIGSVDRKLNTICLIQYLCTL